MATSDPLQPVVLLTDIKDPGRPEIETVFLPEAPLDWLQEEQTEPLDLCLNGTIPGELEPIDFYSPLKGHKKFREESDDDVIFVQEYKANGESGRKKVDKGAKPRRNPVRKARVTKRFEEYTSESFDENEFVEDSTEKEPSMDVAENVLRKNEDSEDWTIEDTFKKGRPRRKAINRKMTFKCNKMGRKRKLTMMEADGEKIALKKLEPLIESNYVLIKDYLKDIQIVNRIATEGHKSLTEVEESERIENAVKIFKQQIILLGISKNMSDRELCKYIAN